MAENPPALDIAALVADHHAVVYRYAFRLTGAVCDAEDLTQQTFLAAQQKLAQLRDVQNGRSWLFAIVRNCYLKTQRKRLPVSAASIALDMETIPDDVPDDLKIDQERLQAAIDELPDEFKLVLVMFYFEDRSYREIAQRLSIPPGTVMSRLSRAKGHLRARLFEHELNGVSNQGPHTAHQRELTRWNTDAS